MVNVFHAADRALVSIIQKLRLQFEFLEAFLHESQRQARTNQSENFNFAKLTRTQQFTDADQAELDQSVGWITDQNVHGCIEWSGRLNDTGIASRERNRSGSAAELDSCSSKLDSR